MKNSFENSDDLQQKKSVKAPDWALAEVERRKKTEEVTKRLEDLKLRAKDGPGSPFVLVKDKGFFEVPAWVVAELSEVNLGFPIGLGHAKKAFKYLEEAGIISSEPQKEWLMVKWAGTAKEAVDMLEQRQ